MVLCKAAVVGAGTMGGGIAQVLVSTGMYVVLKDVDPGQLNAAHQHVEGIYARLAQRGKVTSEEVQTRLASIAYTMNYQGFEDVDIVIEAVPEQIGIKQRVFAELDEVCRPDAILATNTSALSIAAIASASRHPRRVLGMHFFNPAHVMKLVEVIPGPDTAPDIVDSVVALARRMGKTPVTVRECPGFLVNRLLMPYLGESAICLQERAASIPDIDAALGREGFGWPMGPFALMDMLALDVCHHICAYLEAQYGERMCEPWLLKALFEAGRLGQKSGGGFYEYPDRVPSDAVTALIEREGAPGQTLASPSAFSVERPIIRLLNEAFLCVEEGVATIEDVDKACVAGLGMQVRQDRDLVPMGPLAYADAVGLDVTLAQLERFEGQHGVRFRPAAILQRKVRDGALGCKSGLGFHSYAG
jgi:3-hydroxyacyl-CoA dehydrogenase